MYLITLRIILQEDDRNSLHLKKNYMTEIYAKRVFDGFLEAFCFGELYLFDLFTVWKRMGFLWELCNVACLRCSTRYAKTT